MSGVFQTICNWFRCCRRTAANRNLDQVRAELKADDAVAEEKSAVVEKAIPMIVETINEEFPSSVQKDNVQYVYRYWQLTQKPKKASYLDDNMAIPLFDGEPDSNKIHLVTADNNYYEPYCVNISSLIRIANRKGYAAYIDDLKKLYTANMGYFKLSIKNNSKCYVSNAVSIENFLNPDNWNLLLENNYELVLLTFRPNNRLLEMKYIDCVNETQEKRAICFSTDTEGHAAVAVPKYTADEDRSYQELSRAAAIFIQQNQMIRSEESKQNTVSIAENRTPSAINTIDPSDQDLHEAQMNMLNEPDSSNNPDGWDKIQ